VTGRQEPEQPSGVESCGMEIEEAVVIVHGTFASEEDWIQPGSQFRQSLGRQIGKRAVHPFIWSGLNSHKARTEAGGELARFVDRLCSTKGIQRVWCVTHSHGGNVALYALRDEPFAQRLAGIVFFGTPFLHVHRRNLQRFCKISSTTLVLILFVFLHLGAFLGLVLLLFAVQDHDAVKLTEFLFLFFFICGSWYLALRLEEYAPRKLMEFLSRKQNEICGLLAQPSFACPTYVATVPRDEAAFVLTSVDGVSAIPWIGWDVATRAAGAVTFSYAFLVLYGGAILDVPYVGAGTYLINRIIFGQAA
jgi:pimeloyl-ACP methyl ester carboxylesterase